VAVVAVVATANVVGVLSRCRDAIVTRSAGAEHLGVVNRNSGLECGRAMAVLANVGGLHMRRTLARRGRAVVAADAVADDAGVIEYGRQPGRHGVAVVTLVIRRDMRRRLAGGLNAVVAAHTAAGQGRVIHERDDVPVRRDVTV